MSPLISEATSQSFKRACVRLPHCGEKLAPLPLAEFDFRYNNRSALGVEDGTCGACY